MTFPVSASRTSKTVSIKRKGLLISCATAAIAAGVIAPQKARAQAFNGTITASTNASQTGVGTGTETITVSGSKAVIDWAPNEAGTGNIDFLPNGNIATYVGANGVADYTVLNRVVPDGARAIELNGKSSRSSMAARPAATCGSTVPTESSSERRPCSTLAASC